MTEIKNIESMSGDQVGRALSDFGINFLVTNTEQTALFLERVFGFNRLRLDKDYGVMEHRGRLYQLHADPTYHSHPLLGLLPESDARGLGIELRLFDIDPDEAEQRAIDNEYVVLQSTADKPHGLRECFLMDPDGYCWVPSVKLEG